MGDWTIETLKEYILQMLGDVAKSNQQRFDSQEKAIAEATYRTERAIAEADKRYQERFDSQEKAIAKAEKSMQERLSAMNEFRQSLSDQSAKFATADSVDRRFVTITEKLDVLEGRFNLVMPRAEAITRLESQEKALNMLAARMDRTEGQSQGIGQGWQIVVSGIAIIAALVGIWIAFSK